MLKIGYKKVNTTEKRRLIKIKYVSYILFLFNGLGWSHAWKRSVSDLNTKEVKSLISIVDKQKKKIIEQYTTRFLNLKKNRLITEKTKSVTKLQ